MVHLRRALMGIIVAAAALAGINGLAFLGEVVAHGTWYSAGQPAGLYLRDETGRPRLVPGAHLPGLLHDIRINSLGFRGPELAPEKPADGLRVWCLGGSTTFDIYAADNEATWPALVQERLQAEASGRSIEVLNAGIPGETMLGSHDDLVSIGPQVRPDVVVIYHGHNDLRFTYYNPGKAMQAKPSLFSSFARLDLALVRVTTRTLQRTGRAQHQLPPRDVRPNDLRRARQTLDQLVQAARQLGATPVLATHALRAPPGAQGEEAQRLASDFAMQLGMDGESAVEAMQLWNRMIVDAARQQGLPLADVRAAVGPEAENWGDSTHFLRPGSELAAEEVAATILEAGLHR